MQIYFIFLTFGVRMNKVLIITYYWPPSGGSGVQRWVKFSKYLPSLGWQPVIYTPKNPELTSIDHTLEKEVPQEAEVIRRHITEFYGIYHKIAGKKDNKAEVNPINGQKKTFKQRLMLSIRGNFFIPDPRCTWIGPSVRFLKKYLKEHPVDVIVSTGPPHSMHLIARKLSLCTGIPWVADFRDPWTKMFYFKHLELSRLSCHIHEKLEKKVLDDADAVVAVSPLVREDFIGMTDTPIELITNGFDESDFEGPIIRDGYFNITHTGLFASDGNPEHLWEILGDKVKCDPEFRRRLRIRLAGKTDKEIIASIEAAGLADNIVNLGYIDHTEAVEEQRKACVMLLPLRKEPEYKATLPGKLFEYLASGNQILGIGQTDGAMAAIINETETGKVFDWDDKGGLESFIQDCWNNYLTGKTKDNSERISKYSRKATAGQMAALLDRIKRNHR